MVAIGSIIIILLLWITLDLYFGHKHHIANASYDLNKWTSNDVHLLTDGHRFFKQLTDDIKHATDHVHMSFFIFREDTLGKEMIELLKDKARSGVDVRLLVDFFGGLGLKRKTLKVFKQHGIQFAYAAKPSFPYFFYSLNRRNHRKITVIDGRIGYFGGFNVGDEYLGKNTSLGFWQDYHLRVIGKGVHDLQRCFIYDWKHSQQQINVDRERFFPAVNKGSTQMALIPTNGYGLEDQFIHYINKATDHIFIGSPYFIPSKRLLDSLINALDHGVTMTLILPFKKDHPFVKPASYTYITPLLQKGCRIFHYYQGFYHAKVFTIDRMMCHIGTANFDMRSLFLNDEINGFLYDQDIIDKILGMTEEDLHKSIEVTLSDVQQRSLYKKGQTSLSTLLAPLL